MDLNYEKTIYNINISGRDLRKIEMSLNETIQHHCPIKNNEYVIEGEYKELLDIEHQITKILFGNK